MLWMLVYQKRWTFDHFLQAFLGFPFRSNNHSNVLPSRPFSSFTDEQSRRSKPFKSFRNRFNSVATNRYSPPQPSTNKFTIRSLSITSQRRRENCLSQHEMKELRSWKVSVTTGTNWRRLQRKLKTLITGCYRRQQSAMPEVTLSYEF